MAEWQIRAYNAVIRWALNRLARGDVREDSGVVITYRSKRLAIVTRYRIEAAASKEKGR